MTRMNNRESASGSEPQHGLLGGGANSGLRVLIIDDDRELCWLERDYLEPLGYTVTAAHTGPEGLERAISGLFSAILLDVMRPGMDGFEVLMLTARGEEPEEFGFLPREAHVGEQGGLQFLTGRHDRPPGGLQLLRQPPKTILAQGGIWPAQLREPRPSHFAKPVADEWRMVGRHLSLHSPLAIRHSLAIEGIQTHQRLVIGRMKVVVGLDYSRLVGLGLTSDSSNCFKARAVSRISRASHLAPNR